MCGGMGDEVIMCVLVGVCTSIGEVGAASAAVGVYKSECVSGLWWGAS